MNRRQMMKRSLSVVLGLSTYSMRISASDPVEEVFDFIVVGSGPGGGPLAANLAKEGYRVLLLEAGDDSVDNNYTVPAFHPLATEDPLFSWNFYVDHAAKGSGRAADSKTVPGRGIIYPRAGTLGGCSAHNAMVTMYPDNSDWDGIADVTGDSSWNSKAMKEYFYRVQQWLKTEQNRVQLVLKDNQLLKIALAGLREGRVVNELLNRGIASLLAGRPNQLFSLNPNDWSFVDSRAEGVFFTPKSTDGGERVGARERVQEALRRYPDKLFLRKNCLATKVLFRDRTADAIGIEYLEGAHLYEADPGASLSTRKAGVRRVARLSPVGEVILAGGAFNSPQLLMLSGIGIPAELAQFGIPARVALPGVGKNLQDRYEMSVVSQLKRPLALLKGCKFGVGSDPCLKTYQKNRFTSPYASNGIAIGIKKRSTPEKRDPDLFIFGVPGDFRGYYPGWSRDSFRPDRFTWAILKSHTENTKGEVKLRSSDPTATPQIRFNSFDETDEGAARDLESVLQGVKIARRIARRPLFRAVSREEVSPGKALRTDDELKDYIKREAWGHHASCSNKMGPATDPLAVVGSDFKVHKTKNLRIVDASVFPRIPGMFIALPIYMISEKASEVILQEIRAKKG